MSLAISFLWWLFPRIWGLWRKVRHITPHLYFSLKWRSACTHHTLQAKSSPQGLSEIRRLWTSVPSWVVCEFVSLIGTNTMPGQHSQPTRTSLYITTNEAGKMTDLTSAKSEGLLLLFCFLPPPPSLAYVKITFSYRDQMSFDKIKCPELVHSYLNDRGQWISMSI